MPLDFQWNLVHCVIAVAPGSVDIPTSAAPELYDFLSDAAELAGAKQVAAGATGDHIHLLLSLPPTLAPGGVIEQMKMLSSRWIRATLPKCRSFTWDESYTEFSVGTSQIRENIAYIERQADCHRKIDFRTELSLFGEAHQVNSEISPRS
jgi:REP-associated tyrosine transposase